MKKQNMKIKDSADIVSIEESMRLVIENISMLERAYADVSRTAERMVKVLKMLEKSRDEALKKER